ncbi:hypothetical protein [Antarcticirhabdus aurantiaca]|uniref:Uncharacterized protein n=1 Tax=Antarcticirhabdus aurantiaca TaxID=2606717 RepID=A0ACD4NK37_9HYPH|nr:hypothetical protein [Antarcticirhabdus aurantiaca]WAJ27265.1 hypothetical protein OXU80_20785 [Jeongeuplla avenae]
MTMANWNDVARTEAEGTRLSRGRTVVVTQEHIDRCNEEPDGLFKPDEVAGTPGAAKLGQFFPGL